MPTILQKNEWVSKPFVLKTVKDRFSFTEEGLFFPKGSNKGCKVGDIIKGHLCPSDKGPILNDRVVLASSKNKEILSLTFGDYTLVSKETEVIRTVISADKDKNTFISQTIEVLLDESDKVLRKEITSTREITWDTECFVVSEKGSKTLKKVWEDANGNKIAEEFFIQLEKPAVKEIKLVASGVHVASTLQYRDYYSETHYSLIDLSLTNASYAEHVGWRRAND